MGRNGKVIRNEADEVHCQNEREQREHKREEAHPFGSRRTLDGSGDELVGQLDHRLHTAKYQTSPGSAANEECGNQRHGNKHVRCGTGERDLSIANLGDREQIPDLELMNGIYYGHVR